MRTPGMAALCSRANPYAIAAALRILHSLVGSRRRTAGSRGQRSPKRQSVSLRRHLPGRKTTISRLAPLDVTRVRSNRTLAPHYVRSVARDTRLQR